MSIETEMADSGASKQGGLAQSLKNLVGPGMWPTFVLVGLLFPLWGFANDVTNPMVKAFKDIFQLTNGQSSLVQFAFYFGYGVMAIPAALFIRRFSYKSGVLLGLGLYAAGACLFIPASLFAEFNFFLVALWVITCGLALLETTANPYILSLGSPETSTLRLNFAQSLNPIGSLAGMFTAQHFILKQLEVEGFRNAERAADPAYQTMSPVDADGRLTEALDKLIVEQPEVWSAMQAADLITVRGPYLAIAAVVIGLFALFFFAKMPSAVEKKEPDAQGELGAAFSRLLGNARYREGVLAQAFYVGAQIMCWTFVIHYGVTIVGLTAAEAQGYNMIAMVIFLCSRFVSTFLLGFIRPGLLLMVMALGGMLATLGAIFLDGMSGLYSLIAISAFMSLMFPTIYGIALKGLGDDASLGSAGLVMAIVGGALMTQMQGSLIDLGPIFGDIPAIKSSFILSVGCFVVIALYGFRSHFVHKA